MSFLPSVIRAEYCGCYRIHVTFNDDSEKTIDFREWLKGPVFEPLKAPNRFRNFFLDGGTVAWPNGAGIAPETLYEYDASGTRPNGEPRPMTQSARRRGEVHTALSDLTLSFHTHTSATPIKMSAAVRPTQMPTTPHWSRKHSR